MKRLAIILLALLLARAAVLGVGQIAVDYTNSLVSMTAVEESQWESMYQWDVPLCWTPSDTNHSAGDCSPKSFGFRQPTVSRRPLIHQSNNVATFLFDGVDDHWVSWWLTNSIVSRTQIWTVAVWAINPSFTTNNREMVWAFTGTDGALLQLWNSGSILGSTAACFTTHRGPGAAEGASTNLYYPNADPYAWHHYTLLLPSGNTAVAKTYLDGSLISTQSAQTGGTISSGVYFGINSSVGLPFSGRAYDLRVYCGVWLTDAQISNLYNATKGRATNG